MINKEYSNLLTSPARAIKGKAELFVSSAIPSISGDLITLNNVDVLKRQAAVSNEAVCYGKNLINYHKETLDSYDNAPVLTGDILSLSTSDYHFYKRYFKADYSWVKNGAKYTFSEDVLSYSDSAAAATIIALVAMYTDGTYTEHNKVITSTGRQFATITTNAAKDIDYIEIRPVRKGNQTSILNAVVANLQLELGDINTEYERFKEPIKSFNGSLTLHAPNSTIIGAGELSYNGRSKTDTFSYDGNLISMEITREGENKFFGFGICQKLTIKLLDPKRKLFIYKGNKINTFFDCNIDYYINNFPDFYVTDITRDENTNELTITAYDLINDAATHTIAEVSLTAYTLRELATAISALLGLSLEIIEANDGVFDILYTNGANFNGNETIREVLNDIAEATQTIYYITGGKLVFKRLAKSGEAALHISKADYFTLTENGTKTITTLVSATELGDNIGYSNGEEGETQYIRDNAFWDLREDRANLLLNAFSVVEGLAMSEVSLKWRGNYLLEIGDKVTVEAKDGSLLTFYLLADAITYNGGFVENSSWSFEDNERETASNPTSIGDALKQTFAKVDKVNKVVDIVVDEVASLKLTTEGISATVSSSAAEIEDLKTAVNASMSAEDIRLEIKKEINTGVERVTTGTGFTFNEEGLHISKTGNEMNTTITEDGMNVYRDENIMLSANNTGVDAVNLRANTYLIIGLNSRFENYNDGSRTGCFWIG